MDKRVDLHLHTTGDQIILRSGPAPTLVEEKKIDIKGDIKAPGDYYQGKVDNDLPIAMYNAIVTFSTKTRTITLVLDDRTPDVSTTITGHLQIDPTLEAFKINTGVKFTSKELRSLLKMNRLLFQDKDANTQMITNLEKLKVKVSKEIENSNDFRGNKKYLFDQKIESEISLHFKMLTPIFYGLKAKSFIVEICFDVTDADIHFWLESVELKELMDVLTEDAIKTQLDRLAPITTVHVL